MTGTARVWLANLTLAAILVVPPGDAWAQQAADVSLRPGDVLRISVWPDESLSGEFPVEETGNVNLPFLGSVEVAGMSLGQLRSQLRAGYAEVMREPVVSITPLFRVGIMGAVRSPGVYQVDPTQDIIDLINRAGGFASGAKPDEIRIVRSNDVVYLDVERALEEGADLAALSLRSGDNIVVPTRGGGVSVRTVFDILRFGVTTGLLVERLVDGN